MSPNVQLVTGLLLCGLSVFLLGRLFVSEPPSLRADLMEIERETDEIASRTPKDWSAFSWSWVELVNPEGLGSRVFGDQCGIRGAGSFKALGVHEGRTLYRYTSPVNAYGSACETGTLFFMWSTELDAFKREGGEEIRERDELREAVERLTVDP